MAGKEPDGDRGRGAADPAAGEFVVAGFVMAENVIPPEVRERFDRVHQGLIVVHKQLLDHERIRYERQHGRIPSAGEFLRLAIEDPWFAWFRPLTALITQIDEF